MSSYLIKFRLNFRLDRRGTPEGFNKSKKKCIMKIKCVIMDTIIPKIILIKENKIKMNIVKNNNKGDSGECVKNNRLCF